MKNMFIAFILILLASQMSFAKNISSNVILTQEVIKELNIGPKLKEAISGGDIVGNGGGYLEQNFIYTYSQLPSFIDKILKANDGNLLSPIEVVTLKLIHGIAQENRLLNSPIIFVPTAFCDDFFFDSDDAEIRVAKTAFSKGTPIFINTEYIYNQAGRSLNIPTMMAILIHELGHQIGITSHKALDSLGAKCRSIFATEKETTSRIIEGKKLVITVYKQSSELSSSELILTYDNMVIDLSSAIRSRMLKPTVGMTAIGKDIKLFAYHITNIHWARPTAPLTSKITSVTFNGWLDTYYTGPHNILYTVNRFLQITLSISYKDEEVKIIANKISIVPLYNSIPHLGFGL